jgi:hypothetical protein
MLDASHDVGRGGRQVKRMCENTYKENRLYFMQHPDEILFEVLRAGETCAVL